jgi:hypothetical protein
MDVLDGWMRLPVGSAFVPCASFASLAVSDNLSLHKLL